MDTKTTTKTLALMGLLLLPGAALAQGAAAATPAAAPAKAEDVHAALRATALDYIEGWYEGDAARMERALHPDLAKRIVNVAPDGRARVDHMGALALVQGVRSGYGKRTPKDKQQKDVTVLDVFENAAVVKVVASDWVDYLHLGRVNGRWVIINVLWELKPEAKASRTK
jgi:hypothetical protein